MFTTSGKKRATDEKVDGVSAKKPRRDSVSALARQTDQTQGYDLYMAGETLQADQTGENVFLQCLQGKKIKDVFWMGMDGEKREGPVRAYILFSNGNVREWGNDDLHWYHHSHLKRQIRRVPILSQVARINCGYYHVAAVTSDGSLWTWGLNANGQLGRPTSSNAEREKPAVVDTLWGTIISNVVCANSSTIASDNEGNLYTWGSHAFGISGQGLVDGHSSIPTRVKQAPAFKQIAARHVTAGALTEDGKVFTWGRRSCSGHFSGNNADLNRRDDDVAVPTRLEGALSGESIVDIASGDCHMVAVTEEGSVFAWGRNTPYGVLGIVGCRKDFLGPTRVQGLQGQRIKSLSCGFNFTLALSENSIYAWGRNKNGQLGLGVEADYIRIPHKVPQLFHGKVVKAIAIEDHAAVLVDSLGGLKNSHSTGSILEGLFNNPASHPDMEFTSNGEIICYAHKSILCKSSEYFKRMFQNEMMEANQKQFPVHYTKDVFLVAMKFIYGLDLYEDTKPEYLPELFEIADFYCLAGLKEWCRESLRDELTLDNVGKILQDVFNREYIEMEQICVDFLVANAKKWTKNKEFRRQITSTELWGRIFEAVVCDKEDETNSIQD